MIPKRDQSSLLLEIISCVWGWGWGRIATLSLQMFVSVLQMAKPFLLPTSLLSEP